MVTAPRQQTLEERIRRGQRPMWSARRQSSLTAKTHVSRILSKLGARDRAHLVVLAYETGLIRPGERG